MMHRALSFGLALLLPGCTQGTIPDAAVTTGDGGQVMGCPGPGQWTVIRPPIASGANLFGLWGESANHLYAAGSGGTILRAVPADPPAMAADCRPALSFTPMQSGTTKDLTAIHGTAADNLFAVGLAGTILHFDGTAWTAEVPKKAMAGDPAFTQDLWGVFAYKYKDGTDGAVAVGQGGTWVRRDKTGWGVPQQLQVENLARVWGTPAKADNSSYDIYAVGTTGFIFHFNGYDDNSWGAVGLNFTFTNNLAGIFGNDKNDVFAVGLSGSVLRKTQGGFIDYGHAIQTGCFMTALPRAYLRNGVVTQANAAVIVGWDGVILRLSDKGCRDGGTAGSARDESGATDHRLEGIFTTGEQDAVIYVAGAEGIVLRGQ